MAKRRAPVMKVEKNKPGLSAFAKSGNKRRQREKVITCTPSATAALEALFGAVGVKVVTVRPDSDDPSEMLGPLVPDDLEDESDDDTPGGN